MLNLGIPKFLNGLLRRFFLKKLFFSIPLLALISCNVRTLDQSDAEVKNAYVDIANKIFKNLKAGSFKGKGVDLATWSRTETDCEIKIIETNSSRPDIELTYTPKNKTEATTVLLKGSTFQGELNRPANNIFSGTLMKKFVVFPSQKESSKVAEFRVFGLAAPIAACNFEPGFEAYPEGE